MAKTFVFYRAEDLYRTLRGLSAAASENLRKASMAIADKVAGDARSGAEQVGGVAKYVAPTIRAKRDRVPAISMGSRTKLPKSGDGWSRTRAGTRQTIGDVIWGAEFGGQARPTTRQFNPWRGVHGGGYFLWPAVRANCEYIEQAYGDALLVAIDESAR